MNQDSGDTQHYFTREPQVASQPLLIAVTVCGMRLQLWTDRGVFSHGKLDTGTKLLAANLEIGAHDRVLDWGAGYGVLGIVAAKLEPTCSVTMVEVNQRAAELARRNLAENNVANAQVIAGSAPEVLGEAQFDTVISNPPVSRGRQVVEEIIADSHARLSPGGRLWLVIHTRKGAKRYLTYLQQLFEQADTATIKGGYRILVGRK